VAASADGLSHLVVGSSGGAPVRLADVARIDDGGGEPDSYVSFHDSLRRPIQP
jgi:multidrug efflux pump subunit AcrB